MDNTVVYTRESDSFDDLQVILDKWCNASGVKFNKEKTEIIPIGAKDHTNRVIQTRKTHPTDSPLNEDIHIVSNGEAICSLGSWVGNKTSDNTPWEPIINKINKELNRTNLSHLSLKGKRLLAQIIVPIPDESTRHAKTCQQYLNKPDQILHMGKECNAKTSPRLPANEKGNRRPRTPQPKKQKRSHRISVAKRIPKSKTIPANVARFTDTLINDLAPAKIQPEARQNTFLQKWNVPTKGKRAKKMGNNILRMLKMANTHKLTFAPLNISQALRKQLPAWQHLGVDKEIPQNPRAACLVKTHNSTQVKDLLKIAEWLDNLLPEGTHFPVLTCHCDKCSEDRAKGCKNPQCCTVKARNRLNKISLKLDPNRQSYRDNLSLMHRRKEKNASAIIKGGDITFDPSITVKSDLTDCFRIMVDLAKVSNLPAERQPPTQRHANPR